MDNLAKYKKQLILHILTKKNTHIGGYKIVHKCTRATVTVHICTVTVALLYIILIISNLLLFSLSLLHLQNHRPHHLLLPLIHTLPQTQNQKSKINHKHHKTKHTHTRTHQQRQREWIDAWINEWIGEKNKVLKKKK